VSIVQCRRFDMQEEMRWCKSSQILEECFHVQGGHGYVDSFFLSQNFAYRSICEHIRRAHPDNWIPKLPASPETFAKMVNLPSRGLAAAAMNAQFHMRKPQHMPAPSAMAVFRKPGKGQSELGCSEALLCTYVSL